MPTTKKSNLAIHGSSGNVFADLGLPNADELLQKATLVNQICSVIARQKLTQNEAAKRLGIDQPKVSALMHGRLSGFSTDRLLKFLLLLRQDVFISIRPAPRKRAARLLVHA